MKSLVDAASSFGTFTHTNDCPPGVQRSISWDSTVVPSASMNRRSAPPAFALAYSMRPGSSTASTGKSRRAVGRAARSNTSSRRRVHAGFHQGTGSNVKLAVKVPVAEAVMLWVAAPPSDQEAKSKVLGPEAWGDAALTELFDPLMTLRVNGVVSLAPSTVRESPFGTAAKGRSTAWGTRSTLVEACCPPGWVTMSRSSREEGD